MIVANCFLFLSSVSYIFGLIAMLAGLLGVPLGSFLGQKLRLRFPRADPLVCGAGMMLSTPFMLAGLFLAKWNTVGCFAVVFFGQLLLNLNWSIVADMALVRCDRLLFPFFFCWFQFSHKMETFLLKFSLLFSVRGHSNAQGDGGGDSDSPVSRAG